MPQIEATFVVEPYDITISQTTEQITVTPEVLDLNVFSLGFTQPGGNTGELQYNNAGIIGGVPVASYSNGNVVFTSLSNLKLPGGSNAYFLQTDGAGSLTWAPGTVNANSGNGIPVGANTQIQITDGTGNFVSAPGFTFDYATNLLSVPGNIVSSGDGNFSSGNVTALNFFGNFQGNANYANFAGNVVNAAQPNITSLGSLSQLVVLGNIDCVNVNANGTITSLDANVGNLLTANFIQGTLITGAQPNITQVGNLTGLTVAGNALISVLRTTDTEVTLGLDAGLTSQGTGAVAVGSEAGRDSQGQYAVAVGTSAGEFQQSNNAVAIGYYAGYDNQGNFSVAIGSNAASNFQHDNSILINATGSNLDTTVANSFVVKPIRNANVGNLLFYNANSGEITYDSTNAITTIGNLTSLTVSGNYNFLGTGTVQQIKEKVNANGTGATGTINFDLLDGAIINKTANATANFTLNFRGNSSVTLNNTLSSNESITCSFLNTNGAIAYVANNIQVDGTNVTPYWSGVSGNVGSGTTNGKDLYTFNIIKTAANTYTVLASRTGFI